ncbi:MULTISPECIES: sugar phosphate isomerase/epimerase [unclassified Ensifer]|uniref:sugar phosphate isomerase/epimerase family protein n=1 Tax=unclassified Ensifer TaxID=2633371 RepID=UPI000812CC81|nr:MULTISPECIES: sugar phosphate isomerase/epimerase [unclassified Ensifer]OCP00452.1 3-dehydroshikimate dehydratase [Ensifer sp. LC14]OCP05827.1 3-dehydroshikimate dehydratase [Ensifer sp. LC11]OCP06571.1 3-dehydroshikimate dehydratase [Ensifer sp. LC13]OCP31189.1 3-dehydroshikimate dehydratase [Ensifer sp. LC499]
MRVSLCTITFRHHLISLDEIAAWAEANDFQGIELWGAHARNLAPRADRNAEWLDGFGLSVPMISDYLPLDGDVEILRHKAVELCRLARRWRTRKIRTFAGSRGSLEVSADERQQIVGRLKEICTITASYGIHLLAETHPKTLADTAASTMRLIEEVDHPAFAINFDTLHVWEGGDDPVSVHQTMKPHIRHYHLKNIVGRADLAVFEPANVYAAAGSRRGMTPLFEGVVDYGRFLQEIAGEPQADASLEWFGNDCLDILRSDRKQVRQITGGTEPARRTVNL